MDLVFLGSGAFGLPTLRALARDHRILAVATQPDRPAGRGARSTPTPVAAWTAQHLPQSLLLKPQSVNDAAPASALRGLAASAWVVVAFGQKLGPDLLEGAFAINLHASLLPRWRGAAPISAAILAGDAITGNSIISIARRMDAGDVFAQSRRAVEPHQTAGDLRDLLADDGPALVEQVLNEHADGRLRPVPQDESLATRAPKLTRADGWVDFEHEAEACRRRINALSPWPGVAASIDGEGVKLLRAVAEQDLRARGGQAGTIAGAADGTGLVVCGRGTLLRLLEVQPPGRRAMSWAEFARGRRLKEGARLHGGRPS